MLQFEKKSLNMNKKFQPLTFGNTVSAKVSKSAAES